MELSINIGKTTTSVQKEIEDDFPHLPLGCSIVLEKKTKETILDNIKNATSINVNQLITKIINFQHQTTLPLTLSNFIELNNIKMKSIFPIFRLQCFDCLVSFLFDMNSPQVQPH